MQGKGEDIFAKRLKALRRGDPDPVQDGGPGYSGHRPILLRIDQKRATDLNINAAPLEFLHYNDLLARAKEGENALSVRTDVAFRLRALIEASKMSGFKSMNMEPGNGGFGPSRPVHDRVVIAMLTLKGIRAAMPAKLFRMLEQVLCHDVWIWQGHTRKRQEQILESLRQGLDYVALHEGSITQRDFVLRWRRGKILRSRKPERPSKLRVQRLF